MDSKQRIRAAFNSKQPDQLPVLGGWLAWPPTVAKIAHATEDQYWADPLGVSVMAYKELACDGLVSIRQPEKGEFRLITHHTLTAAQKTASPEAVLKQVEQMAEPDQIMRSFDFDTEYNKYVAQLENWQNLIEPMLWLHTDFDCGANFQWYLDWGFEPYLAFTALYPDAAARLYACSGAWAFNRSRVVARAIEEGKHEIAVFIGQDICGNHGPLISPKMLDQNYFPALKHGFKPLLDVGAKIVWHCDGDCRPILDQLFDCGIAGLQGFQHEFGMDIEWIVKRRTKNGDKLIIFGPMSVTKTLQETPEAVYAAVQRAKDLCKDNAHLLLFTSTTVEPEVPLENILAMHKADRTL